jgi:sortase A
MACRHNAAVRHIEPVVLRANDERLDLGLIHTSGAHFDIAAMDDLCRRLQVGSLCVGISLLSLFTGARVFAQVSSRQQIAAFERNAAVDRSLWSSSRARAYETSLRFELDAPVAILRIPSLHLEVPVYARDGWQYLNRGVGIISGMHLPDEGGHVGIAGHRDGFFRALKNISQGDAIELLTRTGVRRYHVSSIRIVARTDRHVLADTVAPSVTLVTCYPFYFVGGAPERFIVHAERSD